MSRQITPSLSNAATKAVLDSAVSTVADKGAQPYRADAVTVVNMTRFNRVVSQRLIDLTAVLSESARDRLQSYVNPVHVHRGFLNIGNQRWSYRFPNLKDQRTVARTSRYYHTQDDVLFREIYTTCADFAINCFAHERTRLKKRMIVGRKDEEINNRKVFFISQLLNILYVAFDEYKTSHNKADLLRNLRHILECCQGVVDECEGGEKLWRSGGETVSFPGTLRQISHMLHTTIRQHEQPDLPSPVEATESLIKSLDHFTEASLMMSLAHMLDKSLPMNAVFLLRKLHHVALLAQAGNPLYEIALTPDLIKTLMKRSTVIGRIKPQKRSLADQLYLELFSSVDVNSVKLNEKQMIYMMLCDGAGDIDTPSHNRRELEPLLAAFRSKDHEEQAMLYQLLYFVGSDFKDMSYAVYDFNKIPTDFREASLRQLGLAPFSGLALQTVEGDDHGIDEDTMGELSSRAEKMLQSLDRFIETPVDHVHARLNAFAQWVEKNKSTPVGIVRQLHANPGLTRVLSKYQAHVNNMIVQGKEIEKVLATLRVASSLFKNLSQADINSLSTVLHSILQVAEESINSIATSMRNLDRSSRDSYVNTVIQNTMRRGKRLRSTEQWHDNLVRVNHYSINSQLATLSMHINQLKRALTKAPDEHLAVRIGLFLKGASSLFGMQLALPDRMLTLLQNHAMRELSGQQAVVSMPVKMLDEIKLMLHEVKEGRVGESVEMPKIHTNCDVVNGIEVFLAATLKIYSSNKKSDIGVARAREQINHWMSDIKQQLEQGSDPQKIIGRWLQLLSERVAQRRRRAARPGMSFGVGSFENIVMLMLMPYLDLPDAVRHEAGGYSLPKTVQECTRLISTLRNSKAGGVALKDSLLERLPFAIDANYMKLDEFVFQNQPKSMSDIKRSDTRGVDVTTRIQAGLFAVRDVGKKRKPAVPSAVSTLGALNRSG